MIPYRPSFSLIRAFLSFPFMSLGSHIFLSSYPQRFLPVSSLWARLKLSTIFDYAFLPPIQSVTHPIFVSPATSAIQQIVIEFLVCVSCLDTEVDKAENKMLPLVCLHHHHYRHHHHACGSHILGTGGSVSLPPTCALFILADNTQNFEILIIQKRKGTNTEEKNKKTVERGEGPWPSITMEFLPAHKSFPFVKSFVFTYKTG